jgi:hypothetical protein
VNIFAKYLNLQILIIGITIVPNTYYYLIDIEMF